jgi:hypothetical protein
MEQPGMPGFWPVLRQKIFLPVFVLMLGTMLVLDAVGKPLRTAAAPQGIVSYELAGSSERAQAVLDSWNDGAKRSAAFSVGLDFLFIFLYTPAIGIACFLSGQVLREQRLPLSSLGVPLAWGMACAGLLDILENIGLGWMLLRRVAEPWPAVSAGSAALKFTLIAAALLYLIYSIIARSLAVISNRQSGRAS